MTKIPCWHCDGVGEVELTGVYAETMHTLAKCRTPVVANRDAHLFGCKPTALNNRLAWLESQGLACSERHGRERRFWAAGP